MVKPEEFACPACEATAITDLFHARDHLVSGKEFLIRQCNVCGMGWTADPPPEAEAGAYYVSEEYISHSDRKQSLSDNLYHFARSFMLRRKRRVVKAAALRSSGVLLDIGSGTGYFAGFMKDRGWQVTGIEINADARNYSAARFGIRVVSPGEIRDIASGSADCITLWHVLEHLYNPAGWLGEVSRILKDGGRCVIALPNFASADAGWFGKRWAALDVPRHLWHFTPGAFERFAARQGFTIERIETLPLDLFYIASLSYRNIGKSMPLLRGAVTGVFIALRSLFNRGKASSLVYVISKREAC